MEQSQSEIIIKKLPANYGYLWFKAAHKLLKDQGVGFQALGYIIFSIILSSIIGQIFIVDALFQAFVSVFLSIGYLTISKKWFSKQETIFSDIFIFFKDQNIREKIFPLIKIIMAIGLFSSFANYGYTRYFNQFAAGTEEFGLKFFLYLLLLFFGFILASIGIIFSSIGSSLILFKNVSLNEAMKISINATLINWRAFTVQGLLLFLIPFIAVLTLFIGLFFILPLFVVQYYLIYISIFEDFDLEEYLKQDQNLIPEQA